MNWGNKIVVAFVLFVGFILFIVWKAVDQRIDLVTENYYAEEIGYQRKLEQKANLARLGEEIEIAYNPSSEQIEFQFPKSQKPTGEIHFYHPSTQMLDKRVPIDTDINQQQAIQKDDIVPGNYRINITWQSDGVEYFQQKQIFIP